MIDLDTLMDLSTIPKDFPLPQDPKMRENSSRSVKEGVPTGEVAPNLVSIQERQGSVRSKLQSNIVDEDTIDMDQNWERSCYRSTPQDSRRT